MITQSQLIADRLEDRLQANVHLNIAYGTPGMSHYWLCEVDGYAHEGRGSSPQRAVDDFLRNNGL